MVTIKLLVLCAAVAVALGKIDNGKSCLMKKNECVSNAECKQLETSNWNCLYGRCVCKSGYWQTSNTKCDSLRTFGQTCKNLPNEGEYCDTSKFLICKNGKCDCKNDKFERDGTSDKCKIKQTKAIDEDCTENEQCTKDVPSGSATCTNNKCKCIAPWTTVDKTCANQKYDNACDKGVEAEKCQRKTGNLECKSNKCACKTDFVWKEWKGMNGDIKMCVHKDTKTNREKGETCHVTAPGDQKWNICSGNLGCRKCSTDSTDTGLCVDFNDLGQRDCSGSSTISASVALLLTAVLAYLAY